MAAKNYTSLIEAKGMRFLITDRPSDANIADYIQVWSRGAKDFTVRS